jgi:phytoene synthase
VLHAAPLPETAFLVEAAAGPARPSRWGEGRSGTVLGLLAQLAAQDRAGRGLAPHAARAT